MKILVKIEPKKLTFKDRELGLCAKVQGPFLYKYY